MYKLVCYSKLEMKINSSKQNLQNFALYAARMRTHYGDGQLSSSIIVDNSRPNVVSYSVSRNVIVQGSPCIEQRAEIYASTRSRNAWCRVTPRDLSLTR